MQGGDRVLQSHRHAEVSSGRRQDHRAPASARTDACGGLLGSGRSGSLTGDAAPHCAAFVLRQASPDTGVLFVLKCPVKTLFLNGAASADRLGFIGLQLRKATVSDGEEQLGVFLGAYGAVPPVHGSSPFSAWCIQSYPR